MYTLCSNREFWMCPGELWQCCGIFLCVVFLKKNNLHRLNYFVCSVRLILVGLMPMINNVYLVQKGWVSWWCFRVSETWGVLFAWSMNWWTSAESHLFFFTLDHLNSMCWVLPHSVVHLGPRAAHPLNKSLFFFADFWDISAQEGAVGWLPGQQTRAQGLQLLPLETVPHPHCSGCTET